MELTQLEHFKAIAECENITLAAEKLCMTQPALSRTLKNLENEIGYPLFDREKNKLKLNQNGILLLKLTNRIFLELSVFKSDMEKLNGKKIKQLKVISFNNAFPFFIMPTIVCKLDKILFTTDVVDQNEIEEYLLCNNCDIAFSKESINNNKICNFLFVKESLRVSIPNDNLLSKRKYLSFTDLNNQNFIGSSENPEFRNWIDDLLKQNHININFLYELNKTSINALGQISDCFYFTSSLRKQFLPDADNRISLMLSDKSTSREIYICYTKSNKEKVAPVMKFIQENYKELLNKTILK